MNKYFTILLTAVGFISTGCSGTSFTLIQPPTRSFSSFYEIEVRKFSFSEKPDSPLYGRFEAAANSLASDLTKKLSEKGLLKTQSINPDAEKLIIEGSFNLVFDSQNPPSMGKGIGGFLTGMTKYSTHISSAITFLSSKDGEVIAKCTVRVNGEEDIFPSGLCEKTRQKFIETIVGFIEKNYSTIYPAQK